MTSGAGQYFGCHCIDRVSNGCIVSLLRYEPEQVQPWHAHENATIFFLLRGSHRDETDKDSHWQPYGSALFRPAGSSHRAIVGEQGVAGINIELSSRWFDTLGKNERDLGDYRLSPGITSQIAALRLALHAKDMTESLLSDLVIEVTEPLMNSREYSDAPKWLLRAEEIVRCSQETSLGLNAVAREVGIDPIHLARTFRKKYGVSVSEYGRRMRVAAAAKQMLVDGLPAAEAASKSGFCDQSHLSRTMRQEIQATPRQVQQLLQA